MPLRLDRRLGTRERRRYAFHQGGQYRRPPAPYQDRRYRHQYRHGPQRRNVPGYVPDTYPAIADHFLVHALIEAARERRREGGFGLHIGLGACDDAFYAETPEWIKRHSRLGLLNIEMESSAIFTVAQLRGVHAAMVCGVSGNLVVADFDYNRGEHGNQRLVGAWEEAILRYDTDRPAHPAA